MKAFLKKVVPNISIVIFSEDGYLKIPQNTVLYVHFIEPKPNWVLFSEWMSADENCPKKVKFSTSARMQFGALSQAVWIIAVTVFVVKVSYSSVQQEQ